MTEHVTRTAGAVPDAPVPAPAPRRLLDLSRADSLALLGSVRLGRIVFTRNALPAIRPDGGQGVAGEDDTAEADAAEQRERVGAAQIEQPARRRGGNRGIRDCACGSRDVLCHILLAQRLEACAFPVRSRTDGRVRLLDIRAARSPLFRGLRLARRRRPGFALVTYVLRSRWVKRDRGGFVSGRAEGPEAARSCPSQRARRDPL